MGRCDPGHSQVGLPRRVQSKKKRPEARPLSSLEVIQGLPLSGQARRRSGGGDYSGRQAAGGKGMNHRSRRSTSPIGLWTCAYPSALNSSGASYSL
jgi:hypothetical protein